LYEVLSAIFQKIYRRRHFVKRNPIINSLTARIIDEKVRQYFDAADPLIEVLLCAENLQQTVLRATRKPRFSRYT